MPNKTKQTQPETPEEPQGRDNFQTPNYAIDLLIPYIPKGVQWIWEPACGEGKIVRRLLNNEFGVFASDILPGTETRQQFNFLSKYNGELAHCIITNPPFSLKQKFYEKCLEYRIPFALLIPADYSGWIIDAVRNGAEKLIPTRRIDYITPNILTRIHEGETWEHLERIHKYGKTIKQWKEHHGFLWYNALDFCKGLLFNSISEVPVNLMHKYSSSDFHSMWLTWGFNLGKSETFVELSLEEKKNNI